MDINKSLPNQSRSAESWSNESSDASEALGEAPNLGAADRPSQLDQNSEWNTLAGGNVYSAEMPTQPPVSQGVSDTSDSGDATIDRSPESQDAKSIVESFAEETQKKGNLSTAYEVARGRGRRVA